MEQLDLSLAITSHGVSLPQLESLPPAHTFTLKAQFTLTTQQKSGSSKTTQLSYRYTFIATINRYLLWGRHHVGNNSLARIMSIYPHFIDEKIEAPRIQMTYSGSHS